MVNELKDITYALDWSSEKRFIVSDARRNERGNWELLVLRAPEPKENDLHDICYLLQMDSSKAYSVIRAQQENDGSWHLELKKQEAADDNSIEN